MKKRTICLLLVLAFVITLLPAIAYAENSDSTAQEPKTMEGLITTKGLIGPDDNEEYSLRIDSYATGEIEQKTVQEQVPTDYILVLDQSGSMSTKDMPINGYDPIDDDWTIDNFNTYTDALYYKVGEKYYRVYTKRGYLYQYFEPNTVYVGETITPSALRWFQRESETDDGFEGYYYFKPSKGGTSQPGYASDNNYYPVTITAKGGALHYKIRYKYTAENGSTYILNRPEQPHYRNLTTGENVAPGENFYLTTLHLTSFGYGVVNGAVNTIVGSNRENYAYAEVLNGRISTGMYVDQTLYKRHVRDAQLCYMTEDGVEHYIIDAEYCNGSGMPVGGQVNSSGVPTGGETSTREAYWQGTLYKARNYESRLSALNSAAKHFIDLVSTQENTLIDGSKEKVAHRIAVAGFSSENSSEHEYYNTELLSSTDESIASVGSGAEAKSRTFSNTNEGVSIDTDSQGKYIPHDGPYYFDGIGNDQYGVALVPTDEETGVTSLNQSIDYVTAYGGTKPADGFKIAEKIIENRGDISYTKANGETGTRNTVVIFFTDGRPGNYSNSNQYAEANEVVTEAKNVKDLGATVYSIGVFGESDGNPLTYPKYKITNYSYGISDAEGPAYVYDENYEDDLTMYSFDPEYVMSEEKTTSSYKYASILNRLWRGKTKNYTENPSDTIGEYMRTVSSEYQGASLFVDSSWYGTGNKSDNGNYSDMINRVRGEHSADRYYFMASSADELKNIFEQISTDVEKPDTPVSLNQYSVLKDVITDKVDLPDDFSIEDNVTAYTVPCSEIINDEVQFDEDHQSPIDQENITYDAANRAILVKGYDYSGDNNIVALDTNNQPKGHKLVVIISGLKAANALRLNAEKTNDEDTSGIYMSENDAEPSATWQSPTLPANAFKVIRKDEKGNQIGDPQLIKADGTFDITSLIPQHKDSNNKVVYEKLYGGIFQDEDLTTVAALKENETGKAFTPTTGETYYLKEVDPSYLAIKTIYTTYGPELKGRYDVALIDNAKYSYVGFDYGEDKYAQSSDYYDEIDVITYKHGSKVDNIVGVSRVFGSGATGKMAVNTENTKDFAGDVHPYWITLDGVKVTGPVIRTMIADGQTEAERTDTEDLAFIKCTPVDIALTNGLDAKGIFVADPDAEGEVAPSESYARILGYTLSLKGNIAMNFYTELSDDVANDPNAYMQFSLPGGNHTAEKVKVSEARIGEVDGKQCYIFPAGIAAKDMTGDIKGQFVQPGGIQSEEKTTSVKWYCEKIIANKDGKYSEKSVELAKAIENYGGYAQLSFGYNTDNLANAGKDYPLPEIDLNSIADPVKNGTCTGAKYLGTTAMLTTTTGLRHYFKLDSDAANYSFMVNGEELEVVSDSKGAYVLIDDVWAKSLGDAIELTVTNKEDDTTFTLSYSVYNYVKQALKGKSTREETKDMVRALYGYGEAAKAYLATEN